MRRHHNSLSNRITIEITIVTRCIEGQRVAICCTRIDDAQSMSINAHIDILRLIHGTAWTTDLFIVLIVPGIGSIPLNRRNEQRCCVFFAHQVRGKRPLNLCMIYRRILIGDIVCFMLPLNTLDKLNPLQPVTTGQVIITVIREATFIFHTVKVAYHLLYLWVICRQITKREVGYQGQRMLQAMQCLLHSRKPAYNICTPLCIIRLPAVTWYPPTIFIDTTGTELIL